jgi:hypothetical protein
VGFAAVLKLVKGLLSIGGDRFANTNHQLSRIDQLAQVDGQAADGNASGSGVARAGSFPRSFLIPGTETSIRIGGF